MAYAPISTHFDHDGTILGSFTEKDHGHAFEFSKNPEMTLSPLAHGGRNVEFPHLVWVTTPVSGRDCGYRRALVGATVAHVIVDERADGSWVVEKWSIKNRRLYQK
jgi:hypothetical protein